MVWRVIAMPATASLAALPDHISAHFLCGLVCAGDVRYTRRPADARCALRALARGPEKQVHSRLIAPSTRVRAIDVGEHGTWDKEKGSAQESFLDTNRNAGHQGTRDGA